jgi:hypothetical protein
MVNLLESAYLAIAFVVFVVVITVGGSVLAGVQGTQYTTTCANYTTNTSCYSVAYNATGSGLSGITNLASQSGTIGTILGAVIIIGLLMGAFMMKGND